VACCFLFDALAAQKSNWKILLKNLTAKSIFQMIFRSDFSLDFFAKQITISLHQP
jgi:hypothetical protein